MPAPSIQCHISYSPQNEQYYHNFTEEEMEAHRGEIIVSSSLSQKVMKLKFKPRYD